MSLLGTAAVLNGVENFASPFMSAQQANVANVGNYGRQQQVANDAQRYYTDVNAINNNLEQSANRNAVMQAGLGKDSMAFRNQIAQDLGRADTFNTLATEGQRIAGENARNLATNYTNARAANAQLMSSLYGGSLKG